MLIYKNASYVNHMVQPYSKWTMKDKRNFITLGKFSLLSQAIGQPILQLLVCTCADNKN